MLDHRIQTFLTLCEEMNYRKTAEKLNMTQPGVTQHIHYLENYYGAKLFEYDGRTLSKTPNALLLKRHLAAARAEEDALKQAFIPSSGLELRVGATKTIGEFVIVPQVEAFLADGSHRLTFTIDNTRALLQMLESSQLDFAVIEGVFDKTRYGYRLFKKEPFVGVCAQNHPFAGRVVPLEEVFLQDIVVREKGSGTRLLLEQAVTDRGFSLDCFARCTSVSNFSVICGLVASTGAITFAYQPISLCRPGLATFAVEDMEIQGEFNFVFCSEAAALPKIQAFMGQ